MFNNLFVTVPSQVDPPAPPTPETTTTTPPATSPTFQPVRLQTFDWDSYLKESNSIPAPSECFKQVCFNIVHMKIIKKSIEKSVLFSITVKQLIG